MTKKAIIIRKNTKIQKYTRKHNKKTRKQSRTHRNKNGGITARKQKKISSIIPSSSILSSLKTFNFKIMKLLKVHNEIISELKYKLSAFSENIPLTGYLSYNLLNKLEYNGAHIYVIFSNFKIVGMAFFKNLTLEFKKEILNQRQIDLLKKQIDINIYQLYYTFFEKDENDEIMTKPLITALITKFRNFIGINKNIVITMMRFIDEDTSKYSMIEKFIPIINYRKKAVNIEKRLGFTYNGYNLTNHNEIINQFTLKFLNENISAHDFFPIYSITRQFNSTNSIDYTTFTANLDMEGLSTIDNVYRYSIENSFIYYNTTFDNNYSILNSVPYYNNFVMNYLSNKLGNSHIVCNYPYLYYSMLEYYGEDSYELSFFAPIISSIEKAQKLLDSNVEQFFILKAFNVYNRINYKKIYIKNHNNLYNILNNNTLYNGYLFQNLSILNKNMIEIKNKYYLISIYFIITYINNIYKVYAFNKYGLLIYDMPYYDFWKFNNIKYAFKNTIKGLLFPDNINEYTEHPLTSSEIKEIQDSMKFICSKIGKMYKNYVNLKYNQMNGFVSFNIYTRLIKIKDHYQVYIAETDNDIYFPEYNDPIHKPFINDYWEWINELVIKPTFNKSYITSRTEDHFQPLEI